MTEWMRPLVRVLMLWEIGDHHKGKPVTNPNSERKANGGGKASTEKGGGMRLEWLTKLVSDGCNQPPMKASLSQAPRTAAG
jgi:hypothetical protein